MLCHLFSPGCRCRSEINAVNVTFQVIDNDGCPVCGAVFRLSMTEGDERYIHAISGKNGCVTFCNVCPGSYELTQLATAFGYELDEDEPPAEVVVSSSGRVRVGELALCVFSVINPKSPAANGAAESFDVNPVVPGDVIIEGVGEPCCKIEATFLPDGRRCCTMVNRAGLWSINVPRSVTLEIGDEISVVQYCNCKPPSEPLEVTVE